MRCWEIVKPILCNDAPEGYALDEGEEDAGINTKDLLSYCWRTLKESRYVSMAISRAHELTAAVWHFVLSFSV